MISYNAFINESKKAIKPTRKDLAVGKMIMAMGQWDNVDINNQLGVIIEMKEYGYILVEFLTTFSPRLHAGHMNIGKDKRCFYISIDNIYEIIKAELAEKIKNKQVIPYKASTSLLRIFKRMKFEPTEEYLDMSFFDVDEKNMEVISYLPSNKFDGDPDTKKGRQSMKVGRILKRLNPALTDKKIEEFVVQYWTAFKILILGEGKNLEVVTGEDIRYWYCNEHYAKSTRGSSELWNSCMSGPGSAPLFNLYCENPDKIALCIYTDPEDKLMARALVWRLDDGGVYMDRVYAIGAEEKQILMDYAAKNGMRSYNKGNAGRLEVTLPKDYARAHRPPRGNPYMDTMGNLAVMNDGRYVICNQIPTKGVKSHARI